VSDLTFDDLRWLHLLWAVLLVAAAGVFGIWRRRCALQRFAAVPLLAKLVSGGGWPRRALRLGLVTLSLIAIVATLIGPRWGTQTQTMIRRNIDIIVLLDVSRSMLAEDIAPNRLERAKLAIRDDLLPALGGDRIGLITFAGDATATCPLTADYGFFRLALNDVNIQSAARGGTLIGDAIRKAGDLFADDKLDTHKVVILITDGEDHESMPPEAAAGLWEDQKVPIVALALGDPDQGARIPITSDRGPTYLKHGGEFVWSKADFSTLERVAGVSDQGAFVQVGTSNFDLGEIYRNLASAIRFQDEAQEQRITQPSRYHPFAVGALLLVLLDSVLWEGRRRSAAGFVNHRAQKEMAA